MIINSNEMTIELPLDKRAKIKDMIQSLLSRDRIKIQELMESIGVLVAACPAVAYGWLYYKNLEKLKRDSLHENQNNPNKKITLTEPAIEDLKWWDAEISTVKNKIRTSIFDLEIFSDASTTGWGATCGNRNAKGFWSQEDKKRHINYLEIKAAFLGLKSFASSICHKQLLLRIDNITALAYLNKMGGIKHKDLNSLTREIWEWCKARDIWMFAEYVVSKENLADEGSRISNLDTEWELSQIAFKDIVKKFGKPTIDLFASRINNKCSKYCSWERDPEAHVINSFTVSWKYEFWYAFPPFSLITKVLKKVRDEGSTGIIVVPLWTAQPWFPEFQSLLVSEIIQWKPSNKLLLSPCREITHPLASSLILVSGIVSARPSRKRGWEMTL
ncbi:uncharacterized protein LOC127284339 [Leptopilina boulardi]|uniref:uncharacterized protein LOC127284339 n=1 Tax=Leptopilina boulardi TaxID=63433 RepID=UPI0021F659FC|nr:uncharacterized protein LOC127284339 [Leptopilina boulardi]